MRVIKNFLLVSTLILTLSAVWGHANSTAPIALDTISLPESLGKIQSTFTGSSDRVIIQIQDVHAHFLAQENIAATLDHLNRHYGITTIALEGGWDRTSFPKSWASQPSRYKRQLALALLEEEYITGPAHAAIFSKSPITLVGIEDPLLYEENKQQYLNFLESREVIRTSLKTYEERLDLEKDTTFNGSLRRFDRSLSIFREGQKAEKFLPTLISNAKDQGIQLDDLGQVLLFNQIMFKERNINQVKLAAESDRIMINFRKSQTTFDEVLKSGKVPAEKLEYYPNTKLYNELLILQDKISHRVFFQQIDIVINRLKDKLITSDLERSLNEKSDRFQLVKRILLLKATPEDIKLYSQKEALILEDMQSVGLQEELINAVSFYRSAIKRDRIFFDKLMKDPALSGNIAVVTGGFHTDGLSSLLKEQNVSYAVITPEIGTEPANDKIYYERLQDTVNHQTLSAVQNRFFTQAFDARFVEALGIFKSSNNQQKALEHVTSFSKAHESNPQKAAAFNLAELPAISEAEQFSRVTSLLTLVKQSEQPLVIVIKTSTLKELFTHSVALNLWEEIIAAERRNTIAVIMDTNDYLEQTIGIRARIVRMSDDSDFESMILRRFKSAHQNKEVVVIDPEFTSDSIWTLPAHPAAFLLAKLVVENNGLPAGNLDILNTLESQLLAFFSQENSLRRSA